MTILNLAIGKSKYSINCDDGEEDKIVALAAKLNERINNLSLALRNVDEKTILMLCALTIEEELDDAKNHQGIFEDKESEDHLVVEYQIMQEDVENAVASQIENTAEYVQKLVRKVENL
jgi:cell division protein ZapA